MNQYETVFILTPVLSDVQMKEAVEKFKGVLQAEGAEIINEENWGLKKLAYPIQKKSTGFYQLIEFNADPTVIDKLEINFRRDERVIRFLTFKMDKYAAEYAAKRRSVKSNKKGGLIMAQQVQSEIRYLTPPSVDVKKEKVLPFQKRVVLSISTTKILNS